MSNKQNEFTILIAEDEKMNYYYLYELLNEILVNKLKLIILHAKNGQEAIEICKNNPQIDIILMDLIMPIVNGFKATKKIKTPVILSSSINWISKARYQQQSNNFKNKIESWKTAWETKNINEYLNFYSKSFNNNHKIFTSWAKHKRRIFTKTKKINLKIDQLNIFSYPGEKDMIAVSFYQNYKGDRYHSKSYKLQYWKKEADGNWRIIYEYAR